MGSKEDTTELLQKLLLEAASGNSSSHNQLIERASARLMELTRKMIRAEFPRLKRWEETSDVFQDAVLKLYRSLEDVRPESLRGFFGLAATQVRRTLIDLARHHFGPHGDAANHQSDPSHGSRVREPADRVFRPESLAEWTRFHEVVGTLPSEEQEAFSLVWYGGMSQKEAAELLDISERTMIRRMNNARFLLQAALAEGSWS